MDQNIGPGQEYTEWVKEQAQQALRQHQNIKAQGEQHELHRRALGVQAKREAAKRVRHGASGSFGTAPSDYAVRDPGSEGYGGDAPVGYSAPPKPATEHQRQYYRKQREWAQRAEVGRLGSAEAERAAATMGRIKQKLGGQAVPTGQYALTDREVVALSRANQDLGGPQRLTGATEGEQMWGLSGVIPGPEVLENLALRLTGRAAAKPTEQAAGAIGERLAGARAQRVEPPKGEPISKEGELPAAPTRRPGRTRQQAAREARVNAETQGPGGPVKSDRDRRARESAQKLLDEMGHGEGAIKPRRRTRADRAGDATAAKKDPTKFEKDITAGAKKTEAKAPDPADQVQAKYSKTTGGYIGRVWDVAGNPEPLVTTKVYKSLAEAQDAVKQSLPEALEKRKALAQKVAQEREQAVAAMKRRGAAERRKKDESSPQIDLQQFARKYKRTGRPSGRPKTTGMHARHVGESKPLEGGFTELYNLPLHVQSALMDLGKGIEEQGTRGKIHHFLDPETGESRAEIGATRNRSAGVPYNQKDVRNVKGLMKHAGHRISDDDANKMTGKLMYERPWAGGGHAEVRKFMTAEDRAAEEKLNEHLQDIYATRSESARAGAEARRKQWEGLTRSEQLEIKRKRKESRKKTP